MASIRERRPGVWEVRAFTGRDAAGRVTHVSRTVHGGKRDAERVAAQLTVSGTRQSGGRTVSDLLQDWIALNEPSWATSSARDQKGRAALLTADPIAKMAVARLSVADVDRWHTRLRRAGVGQSSIRNQHSVLRAALTQAVRWGWVSTNVAALARLMQPKKAPRGALEPEDVRKVIDAAATFDPAAALALRVAAITGARRSELAALRWDDLQGERLTIDSAVDTIRNGKRGDARHPTLVDAATKTANRREVMLDRATVAAVQALQKEREQYGPWMFAIGEQPPNPDRIGAWWRRAREIAGLDERWRLHDLRHWAATLAIARGHDVRTVGHRLGHANAAMTLQYAHPLEEVDRAVAVTLADAISAKPSRRGAGRAARKRSGRR